MGRYCRIDNSGNWTLRCKLLLEVLPCRTAPIPPLLAPRTAIETKDADLINLLEELILFPLS
jgi:hypothetical protein